MSRTRHLDWLLLAALSPLVGLSSRPLNAQIRSAGDVDPQGRVLAKVSAAMTEQGALPHPVSGLRVRVIAESGEESIIRTDDAGIATSWVPPGTYRFVSQDPIAWQGVVYRWDLVVRMAPGTGTIRFTQETATAQSVAEPSVESPARPPSAPSAPRLRVFADCQTEGCDLDYFKTEIPFVDYVRDRQDASVHILITSQQTGAGGRSFSLNFIGAGPFAGTGDTLRFEALPSSTAAEKREGLARAIKLGLARYVARTGAADAIQINYSSVSIAAVPTISAATPDPWNLWVFSMYLNGTASGEESQHFFALRGSTSANRVSDSWKFRFTLFGSYDEGRYTLSDETKFKSVHRSHGASQLLVKSMSPHWSVGERASVSSSSFLNQRFFFRFAPAIEFNLFPYSESTRRLFTVQYSVGVNSFRYEDTTIFNKLSETRPHQSLLVSLGLREPWGSVSSSVEGGAYIDDFSKQSAVFFNNLDVRVVRGLSLNVYGGLSLIRDQLYLAKGELSDEDILVRRRQLASKYSYFAGVGLSFSFGSIFNNVVNPRFEGIGGSTIFF
jgi:hypothetical protein